MNSKKLLMISTDRKIFEENSDVRKRQIEYAKNWQEVHIIVFALAGKYPRELSISENCKVYSTNSYLRILYIKDAINVGKRILRKNAIDEITCQDTSFTANAGLTLAHKYKIPIELQVHGDISSPFSKKGFVGKWRNKLTMENIPKADKIRVVSGRIKNYVEGLISNLEKKPVIELRPIAVNEAEIINCPITADLKSKYKQYEFVALMASRFEKEKNIKLAIRAWVEVIKSFPKAGLIIVGQGSLEPNLKALVVESGLAKSVIFENWVDKMTLYSYYKTADLFLNTSLFEGYGLTLKEASVAGAATISTDVGIASEVGAIISSFDSHDLATKIRSVFMNKKKKNYDQ